MATLQSKIIVLTAMHGRHQTVKYCLEKLYYLPVYCVYSTPEDGNFLRQFKNVTAIQRANNPLSEKWNAGVKYLSGVDFKYVILLGSDDYFTIPFVEFIDKIQGEYDLIAFRDLYFKQDKELYYWPGYSGAREGEPAGAGKVYTKDFLKRIRFDLFPVSRNYSLDGMSWNVVQNNKARIMITGLKANGLFLCDIKDGQGLTDLSRITNVQKL